MATEGDSRRTRKRPTKRGAKPKPRRNHGVSAALRPKVIELRLAGWQPTEIAVELGRSKSVISDTLARPDVQEAIEQANVATFAAIAAQRARRASKALDRLEKLMDGDPDPITGEPKVNHAGDYVVPAAVQRQAARDILVATGLAEPPKAGDGEDKEAPQPTVVIANLTRAEMRMIAFGDPEPRTIDVTPDPDEP